MRVGILYNQVKEGELKRGAPSDIVAENEVVETVFAIKSALENKGYEVLPIKINRRVLAKLGDMDLDMVFNLAEGLGGDTMAEARIPDILETLGIPYTGSNSLTLYVCRDKPIAKQILSNHGIKTPKYQQFENPEEALNSTLSFPLIVKPAREDGSLGIGPDSVVQNEKDLKEKVRYISKAYRQPALVEEYIDGRELNVSILGSGESAKVFPISEVTFNLPDGFPKIVNFEAKWKEESEWYKGTISSNAALSEDVEKAVKDVALRAYRVMGGWDYGRVDIRLKDSVPYVLDVNPNPCINPSHSGFVASMKAGGLSFDQMLEEILKSAFGRSEVSKRNPSLPVVDKIEAKNLTLKPVTLREVDTLVKWFNDNENLIFMENGSDVSREYLEQSVVVPSSDFEFVAYVKEKPVGYGAIYSIDKGNARGEISFLIGEKEFQGKGYGEELAKALVDFAFRQLKLNSLFASATTSNIRSIKALQKIGFKKVGVRREYQKVNGEFLDEVFFDLTSKDYNLNDKDRSRNDGGPLPILPNNS